MIKTNCSLGKQYKLVEVPKKEPFSWAKFFSGFFAFNGVNFAKDIVGLFNIRKLILYAIIITAIFGWGWYQGKINNDLKIDIGQYKNANIKLHDGNILHIGEDGVVTIRDTEGNILKRLKSKDLDALREDLKPLGFILEPIAVVGGSVSTDGDFAGEAGIGVSWFKAWKLRVDSFLTTKGVYPIGVSYKLDDIGLKNSAVGIGAGTSYDNFLEDKRLIAYFSLRF